MRKSAQGVSRKSGPCLALVVFACLVGEGARSVEPQDAPKKIEIDFGTRRFAGEIAISADENSVFCEEVSSPGVNAPTLVVERWNLGTGRMTPFSSRTDQLKGYARRIIASPRGRYLAALYGGRLSVWDLKTEIEILCVEGSHLEADRADHLMMDAAFTADDESLLVLLFNKKRHRGSVERWNLSDGKFLSRLVFEPSGLAQSVSRQGKYAVVMGIPNEFVIDLATGKPIYQAPWFGDGFAEDDSELAEATGERVVIRTLPDARKRTDFKHELQNLPMPLVWCKRRGLLVLPGPKANQVQVIKMSSKKRLGTFDCGAPGSRVISIRLSPSGKILATQTGTTGTRDQAADPVLSVWRLPESW